MANEIQAAHSTGATLYAHLVRASDGGVYNGSGFETPATANWANYDLAMTEASTTGYYRASMPAVAAGIYNIYVYLQAGETPAASDSRLQSGWINWNGSADAILAPETAGRTLVVSSAGDASASLANVAHGGTSATLRLGGSTSTPALYVTNSGGDATKFESTGGNGYGLHVDGDGSGSGLRATGGATGSGAHLSSGISGGNGLRIFGASAHALHCEVDANDLHGAYFQGQRNGHGIYCVGANGDGSGTGSGLCAASAGTGHGALLTGGATSGDGLRATAGASGAGVYAVGLGNHGLVATASSGNVNGAYFVGNGTGHGLACYSGSGATGNGIFAEALSTNGKGMHVSGSGFSYGFYASGGPTGAGGGFVGGGTSGVGLLVNGANDVALSVQSGNGIGMTVYGTTNGILVQSGGTSDALLIQCGGSGGNGINAIGAGAGAGVRAVGVSVAGALSAGTNSLPWNTSWDAEVQSECADALTAYGASTYAGADTAGTTTLLSRLTGARAGYLDNLSGGAVALAVDLATATAYIDTKVAAIKAKTDNFPASFPANFASLAIDSSGRVKVQGALTSGNALDGFTFVMTNNMGTPLTGLSVTATRSIDGGAFSACANAVSEVGSGVYVIDLAAADLNGTSVMLKFAATGARTLFVELVLGG